MSVSEAVQNPRSYFGRKQQMYRSLLFDPESFYENHPNTRGITTELLLVSVIGLLGTLGAYYAVRTLMGAFGGQGVPDLSQDVSMQLWRHAVAPLVGAFVLWIGFAVALYAVSWLYSTVGGLFETLKLTAWAIVPLAFANLVRSVALVVTAYGLDVETDLPSGLTSTRVDYVWSQVGEEPLVVGATALGILFTVWTGYIAAHAIADVRDLSVDEAYRVAAVPTLVYAGFVAYQVVGAL